MVRYKSKRRLGRMLSLKQRGKARKPMKRGLDYNFIVADEAIIEYTLWQKFIMWLKSIFK